jgi:hypothetical protein
VTFALRASDVSSGRVDGGGRRHAAPQVTIRLKPLNYDNTAVGAKTDAAADDR